ncbi:hypothetical protein IC229_21370 [Spirosoma sp. BT702]|uniref:Uncharacterized protein n=1 Tax=Spirosoma profusum TaxID=2771354 RepID=A0A926XYJ4_9BACT|nr:hypothetical protein [Spirosoma profusum]MBD2703209.1 hypothetical protein [Spirosoma profusum]
MAYRILNSENEITHILNDRIKQTNGNIIIQAGHFALVFDKDLNKLIPAIPDDISSTEVKKKVSEHPYMGAFPVNTWELALKIALDNPDKNIKTSIIVNDWQWVPKSGDGAKNILRENFYKNDSNLPNSFRKLLAKYSLSDDILLPLTTDKDSLIFFGEQKMRNRARSEFSKLVESNTAISCSIGYLPFLNYVDKTAVDLLISFIPKSCKEPINFSTEYYLENYSQNRIKIINVFFNGIFESNFFEQSEYIDFF